MDAKKWYIKHTQLPTILDTLNWILFHEKLGKILTQTWNNYLEFFTRLGDFFLQAYEAFFWNLSRSLTQVLFMGVIPYHANIQTARLHFFKDTLGNIFKLLKWDFEDVFPNTSSILFASSKKGHWSVLFWYQTSVKEYHHAILRSSR